MAFSLASCDWFLRNISDKYTVDTPDDFIDQKTITGRILDFNGSPISGIEVSAYYEYYHWDSFFPHSDYTLKATSITDEKGYYSLDIYRKQDENDIDSDSDSSTASDSNMYYIKIEEKEGESFYRTRIFFTWDIEDFWRSDISKMDDFILYPTKHIEYLVNQKHPDAASQSIFYFENSAGPSDTLMRYVRQIPLEDKLIYFIGGDLVIKREWGKGLMDSLIFNYPDIPDVIDASYYP